MNLFCEDCVFKSHSIAAFVFPVSWKCICFAKIVCLSRAPLPPSFFLFRGMYLFCEDCVFKSCSIATFGFLVSRKCTCFAKIVCLGRVPVPPSFFLLRGNVSVL